MKPERVLEVAADRAGDRLDVFLAGTLELSRRQVRRLLDSGRVRVDGAEAPKGLALRGGERIEVSAFRHPADGPVPDPAVAVAILAEGEGLVAVDKPAGLPSHPLDFEEVGTAASGLLALRPGQARIGDDPLECGLVHRLDTLTSGALVFATRADAWRAARDAFAARRVQKRYVARVHGRLEGERDVRLRLAQRGSHVRVVERGGRESHTRVRGLECDGQTSRVEVWPISGMRHQIRAVLAHLGHPVLGDHTYGSPTAMARHLLHAEWIRIGAFEAHSPSTEV